MPEGPCGFEAIEQFQNYLGPKGYQVIVVDPVRGGVIFTGEAYKNAPKVIQLVKTYCEDGEGETKAHYDGLYSVAPVMNRSKFCRYCCKGYDHEEQGTITVYMQIAPAVNVVGMNIPRDVLSLQDGVTRQSHVKNVTDSSMVKIATKHI